MANNYTDFSFELAKDLTTEEIKWLNDNTDYEKIEDAGFPWPFEDEYISFTLEVDDNVAYIYSGDGEGCVEQAVNFCQFFLRKHRPTSQVIVEAAFHCSKPRVGEFGGCAVLVTAEKQHWFNSGYMADVFSKKNGDTTLSDLVNTFEYDGP